MIRNRKSTWSVCLLALLMSGPVALSATWYVDDDAVTGGDGMSWGTAFTTIQAGIDAAVAGDEVVIADGTYTGDGNKNLDFGGKAITVRSASGNPEFCIIDCEGAGRGFYLHSGEDADSLIDGLTIKNGYVDENNQEGECAARGGGILCLGASPIVANCVIAENTSTMSSDPDKGGGGVFCRDSSMTLIGCVFIENNAGYGAGGGVYSYDSWPNILNCVFAGNTAFEGAGMHTWCSMNTLVNCVFDGNIASFGGGGYNNFQSGSKLINCIFSNNEGLYQTGRFGNAISNADYGLYIDNCILWGDTPQNIHSSCEDPCIVMATASILQGGTGESWFGTGCLDTDPLFVDADGPDDDPATWADNDFRLRAGSPCIDAGSNSVVPADEFDLDSDGDVAEPLPFDLDGVSRFLDAPDTPDTGEGTAPIVDMGAYEYPSDCGDGACDSGEDQCGCPADCGTPPASEGDCSDAFDNDCDGMTDMDDPDCIICGDTICSPGEDQCSCPADCGTPPATEDNCTDAYDNDCDGFIDLNDMDCSCGNGVCSYPENQCNCPSDCGTPPTSESECSDGLDNDCDGLTDKHDDDCWICGNHYCDPNEDTCSCSYDCGNPLPAEESCRDGGDDDCDGLIDMDDPDCQLCGDGICSPGESASTCPMDCDPTTIIFVDDSAPSGGDGSSWATAYTDLVSALENAASGDTIWVASGTYSAGEANYHSMVDGVSLFGGFAGTEVPGSFHLADRDFEINPSTLSGRYFSAYANNLSESIIIDGFALRRIIRIVGSDLTVRNITAANGGSLVSCEDSTVTVENAVANPGGGFTISNSTVDIKNCDVGLYNHGPEGVAGLCAKIRDSTVRMINVRMHDSYRPDWNGGAMDIQRSDITFINSAIYNNKVDGHKGMGGSGGGICITDGSLTIINSLFVNNKAYDFGGVTANGGAIAAFGDVEINVSASIFSGNEADDEGDDIWQENKASNWSQLKNRYPTFVNPEEGNFYLLPTSSYIDLGSSTTPEPDMSLDLIQNPRKVGKRVDYGPIEFHGRPFCGNGLCDEYETPCTCPGDCGEPEGTESLCQNGLDDDCDGLVDADDEDCLLCGDSICSSEEDQCGCPQDCGVPPLVETNCSDGFDDDCDRLIDRLDPDCLICGDGFCTYNEDSCSCPGDCGYPFPIELECSDGFDNDCDGLIDALDPDCPDCGNSVCESGENSCNCPEDCGVPPTTEVECSDSIDNDCDGLVDIQDPDCPGCGNSVCEEDENSCSCPNDCGEPEEIELVCNDGIDDDCDGLVDIQDPDCPGCGNSVCEEDENSCTCPNDCGEPAEIELVCDDGIDDDCDGLVDTLDPDCCGNGICEAGENSCVCSEDCGDPSDIELVCDDGFDDDCDGLIDALDPDCPTCGNGICEAREDSCSCSEDCGEPPFELCYDGISNDCDALADSADPDCNCGDGTCTPGEDACHCPADCGTPPESETNCSDGLDNDCDGYTDYYDSDCGTIPGDVNYDGDVDLEDFQSFQMCWSRSAPACLEYFDLDDDGDLDLDDFSMFESNFTGPR